MVIVFITYFGPLVEIQIIISNEALQQVSLIQFIVDCSQWNGTRITQVAGGTNAAVNAAVTGQLN